jgi:uncharacterized protein YndB with AHSA1/START domain
VRIEKTVTIACPVENVWAFIADARNDPRWCDKVVSVEQLAGDGPGPQSRYRVIHRPVRAKKPKELAVTVEEYEPPKHLRLREEDDHGVFHITYDVATAGEGSMLTQTDEIEWKIPRIQLPVARVMVSRDLRRQFSSLKRILEAR